MTIAREGEKGIGHTGYTKYEANKVPVGKEVNDSLHNGKVVGMTSKDGSNKTDSKEGTTGIFSGR